MEAPLCKICRYRHYGPCHGTIETPAPTPEPATPKAIEAPRGSFDRNAYQREYMRKRRAEQVSVNAIYAIVQHNKPEIVKIGQTKKWRERRGNFAKTKSYAVYFISSPVDLKMIENACLMSMGVTPCHGKEWFKSSIESACLCIELILNTLKLPYKVEKRSNQEPKADKTGPFDRNAYQREYMRRVRQKAI